MIRGMRMLTVMSLASGVFLMTGCSIPKMTIDDMKKMKPARAPELDQLDMFLGSWSATVELNFTFLDKPVTGTGTSNVTWECDRTVLLNRGEYDMGELGKMSGMEAWTWDAKAKKFRLHWIDSWGHTGHGTAKYDAGAKTWHVKAKGKGPDGHSTVAEGTIDCTNPNTMAWSWTEWTWCKCAKIGDMKGTNKRVTP